MEYLSFEYYMYNSLQNLQAVLQELTRVIEQFYADGKQSSS